MLNEIKYLNYEFKNLHVRIYGWLLWKFPVCDNINTGKYRLLKSNLGHNNYQGFCYFFIYQLR